MLDQTYVDDGTDIITAMIRSRALNSLKMQQK